MGPVMPKKLKYLAVCLLVLLNVVSTMGGDGNDYKYYISKDSTLCISLKNNRLTDCCKQDVMQQIYVTKTGAETGIYHIKDFKRVLCYDTANNKFKAFKRVKLGLCKHRHRRRRERRQRRRRRRFDGGCKPSPADLERLKLRGCELYEVMGGGYTHISFDRSSRFLGLWKGRVRKHKRLSDNEWREGNSAFISISENSFHGISSKHAVCRA